MIRRIELARWEQGAAPAAAGLAGATQRLPQAR